MSSESTLSNFSASVRVTVFAVRSALTLVTYSMVVFTVRSRASVRISSRTILKCFSKQFGHCPLRTHVTLASSWRSVKVSPATYMHRVPPKKVAGKIARQMILIAPSRALEFQTDCIFPGSGMQGPKNNLWEVNLYAFNWVRLRLAILQFWHLTISTNQWSPNLHAHQKQLPFEQRKALFQGASVSFLLKQWQKCNRFSVFAVIWFLEISFAVTWVCMDLKIKLTQSCIHRVNLSSTVDKRGDVGCIWPFRKVSIDADDAKEIRPSQVVTVTNIVTVTNLTPN